MNLLQLPWLELAVVVPLIGALWVSRLRDPYAAHRWCLAFTGAGLIFAVLASLAFYYPPPAEAVRFDLLPYELGRQYLRLDELSAPLLPVVALLHFLTAFATTRTKMRRFSFTWSLTAEALRMATFGTTDPGLLIVLLAVGTVPAYVELRNRGRPTGVFVAHMAVFVGLLFVGLVFIDPAADRLSQSPWATFPLLAAVLVRCGVCPLHCWLTDWFEHASFGNALLFVAPLVGVYAAVRLVLPFAPDWALQGLAILSLGTAVYAAGMAMVQREVRRFFAYLFLSHASLVLVGLELVGVQSVESAKGEHLRTICLTGALALWVSVALSLGGFGLTLRALEARFGRLSLSDFHGLYEHSPALAVCFMLTGLASVGFPGTLGYVAAELLVDGAVEANLGVGIAVVVAAALNGIAVVRAYFYLFTGMRHVSTVSLNITVRERLAVLTLAALILGVGIHPQPNIESRHRAAEVILKDRKAKLGEPSKQD
jgi:NADH-quinone oxidoreductase subunit M